MKRIILRAITLHFLFDLSFFSPKDLIFREKKKENTHITEADHIEAI